MDKKDSSKKQLTSLFNEKITSSTPVSRAMSSLNTKANIPFVSH
jgi:hypothetical protein